MVGMGWLASQRQEKLVPAQPAEQRAATTDVAEAKENTPQRRGSVPALHHPARHQKLLWVETNLQTKGAQAP
jgi:hypothetical protein